MNDFPKPPIDSMAGVATFQFIEAIGIDTMAEIIDGRIDPPTFKTGYNWKNGYSAIDSLQFTEEPAESDNGIYFNAKLNGFVPDATETNILFNEMQGRWFIVKLTDNDGIIRLAGTLEQPLQFSSYLDTETTSGQKGHSFSFKGIQKNKVPIYNNKQ